MHGEPRFLSFLQALALAQVFALTLVLVVDLALGMAFDLALDLDLLQVMAILLTDGVLLWMGSEGLGPCDEPDRGGLDGPLRMPHDARP